MVRFREKQWPKQTVLLVKARHIRLSVYRVTDIVNDIGNSAFHASPTFLGFPFGMLNFAFGLKFFVIGQFSDLVFDRTFDLFPFAFSFVIVKN